MSAFSGRTALITGGASGIGRCTALRLASEGAAVVAVDVNDEALADEGLTGTKSSARSTGSCIGSPRMAGPESMSAIFGSSGEHRRGSAGSQSLVSLK